MKKYICFSFAVMAMILLTIGLVSCNLDNSSKNDSGLIFNQKEDSTYTVSGYTGSASTVVIPATYKGSAVTSIGAGAFKDCYSLIAVTIPDSIVTIESMAFANCVNLVKLEIPFGVKLIEEYAFERCASLISINIPNSVTNIGAYAFRDCTNIQETIMPAVAISHIPKMHLKNVVVTNGTSIEFASLAGCTNLTSITLPFVGASSNGTSNMHFGYIFGATDPSYNQDYVPVSLKTVVITSGTIIGDRAFEGCSGLTSVTLPDSVTRIGSFAFSGCAGLTSITIPENVMSIGSSAFSECTGLTSIDLFDGVNYIYEFAFKNCSNLVTIVIPNSVTHIGDAAFSGCSKLNTITIPMGVTDIYWNTFEDCVNLTSVTVPTSIMSIEYYAFNGCRNLGNIFYAGTRTEWNAIFKMEDYLYNVSPSLQVVCTDGTVDP